MLQRPGAGAPNLAHTMLIHLELQNGQTSGPCSTYTLYFGILGHQFGDPGPASRESHDPEAPEVPRAWGAPRDHSQHEDPTSHGFGTPPGLGPWILIMFVWSLSPLVLRSPKGPE